MFHGHFQNVGLFRPTRLWAKLCVAGEDFVRVPAFFNPSFPHTRWLVSCFRLRPLYRKLQMISNSFNKQHAKGNPRKLSFDHVTVISTARTYSSITNRSGLTRAFRPYIVLWGFDQFSRSYATSKFYSAPCMFVRTTQPSRRGSTRAEKTQQP